MPVGHFKGCGGYWDCCCEEKRYWIVLWLIFVAFVVEIIGSWYSGSLALLGDTGHVFVDGLSVFVSIIVARRVKKIGQDLARSNKIRAIGGYTNAALLGLIAVLIFYESLERFFESKHVFTASMIVAAAIGLAINWYQHCIMEKAPEIGGHRHVTHISLDAHILGDLRNSVAVIIAGALIWLTGWLVWDPIASILIALWMVDQMFGLFRASHLQSRIHEV
ncbi:MAG: cation diffusion facilitator family transporter [bacterium]|nr:cation diffusion facilitator family transporter [bacterium]